MLLTPPLSPYKPVFPSASVSASHFLYSRTSSWFLLVRFSPPCTMDVPVRHHFHPTLSKSADLALPACDWTVSLARWSFAVWCPAVWTRFWCYCSNKKRKLKFYFIIFVFVRCYCYLLRIFSCLALWFFSFIIMFEVQSNLQQLQRCLLPYIGGRCAVVVNTIFQHISWLCSQCLGFL